MDCPAGDRAAAVRQAAAGIGKSLGKGIVEFKKGLKGVDDEIEQRSNANYQQNSYQQGYQGQLPNGTVQTMPPMQQGQPNTVGRADAPQH